jgi:hypothetical protein
VPCRASAVFCGLFLHWEWVNCILHLAVPPQEIYGLFPHTLRHCTSASLVLFRPSYRTWGTTVRVMNNCTYVSYRPPIVCQQIIPPALLPLQIIGVERVYGHWILTLK